MVRTSTRQRGRPRRRPARHGTKTAVQHAMPYKLRKDATTKDLGVGDQTPDHVVDAVLDDNGCAATTTAVGTDLERELVTCVFSAADTYFGLSPEEVRRLAYQFALKHEQPVSPEWRKHEMASEGWFSVFLKQNPSLPISSSEGSLPPGEYGLHRNNGNMFLSSLENLMKRCCFRPEAMWYMQEIGISVDHLSHNRVATRGNYQQVPVNNSVEQSGPVTVTTCAVSAAGTTIPPFFAFPASEFREDLLTGAPAGSSGCASYSNGWMREDQFIDFLKHFVRHSNCSPERPCVLLTGSFVSYLSIGALDFARENGVMWLTLPNQYLPLRLSMEWSICEPITTHIRAAIEGWLLASAGKPVSVQCIPAIVARVLPLATLPRNIKAGFKSCGLFPLKPDIVTDFSVNHHPTLSEAHPHSKPTSTCNGGGGDYTRNAENHMYAAEAHDKKDHCGNIECSHTLPPPGASTTTNGKTTGCVDIQESSEEDEGFCQVCMEPQGNSEVACQQCTVGRNCTSSDVPTSIAPIAQSQGALQSTDNADITMDDGPHKLQNNANCDSSTIQTGHNLTHPAAPEMSQPQDVTHTSNGNVSVCSTNGTLHLTHHHTISPNLNIENHTHTALLPTTDTHTDSVATTNTPTTHTSEDHGEVELLSALVDFPQSPTPLGSSSPKKPAGRTPDHLESDSESSDDGDGLCQMCMQRFPHANSEVLCLQCILRRKWGQSDHMDVSLNSSSVTSSQGDFETDHDNTVIGDLSTEHPTAAAAMHEEDSHNLHTHSLSDLSSPTHNARDDAQFLAQPAGEINDSHHNQSPQQSTLSTFTDETSDLTKQIAVPCHNNTDHTPVDLVLPLTTQNDRCEIPMEQHCSADDTECNPSPTLGAPTETTWKKTGCSGSPGALDKDGNAYKVFMPLLEQSSTDAPNPSIHNDSHGLQNLSHSVPEPPTHNHSHSMSQPTGELENNPNQSSSSVIDDSSDLPCHDTTVSCHEMTDHTCGNPDSCFNVQDDGCETPMELHCSATEASECSPSEIADPSTETTWPTSIHPPCPDSSTKTTEIAGDIAVSCHSITDHGDVGIPLGAQGGSCETPMEEHCSAAEASECTPCPIVDPSTETTGQTHDGHPPSPDSSTETTRELPGQVVAPCEKVTDHIHVDLDSPLSTHEDGCEPPVAQRCPATDVSECTFSPIPGTSTDTAEETQGHTAVSFHGITDDTKEYFDSPLISQDGGCETPMEQHCSPVPGPSMETTGQTPGQLGSSESSDDDDDDVCQVCMEPFEHSNSEVMCLRCVLQKKWGRQSGSFF
ncbi:uncharacterized protein LOC134454546 [Engraulis encrasicolus]|uniref:uncharacterized protein LOC134454546 n=1 Tax=Engraulis encrasicolus TaxID=184585 RepID=UPI002FD286B4